MANLLIFNLGREVEGRETAFCKKKKNCLYQVDVLIVPTSLQDL